MKIALAAEEAAGLHTLRTIVRSGCELVGVFTSDISASTGFSSLAGVARKHDIPVWPAAELASDMAVERLRPYAIDLFVNVHSLQIVHPDVLGLASIGSFNLHPGPLPDYAGLNVPSWAVFNGESRHAVTLHWMSPNVDTGPIAYQSWFDIGERATGLSVSTECVRRGLPLIEALLTAAAKAPDSIPQSEQDASRRRLYMGADVPFDGLVPWHQPAIVVERMIRAADFSPLVSPWGHPQTRTASGPISIVKAFATAETSPASPGTVVRIEGNTALVASADNLVCIERVIDNGRRMAAAEMLQPGQHLA